MSSVRKVALEMAAETKPVTQPTVPTVSAADLVRAQIQNTRAALDALEAAL